MTILLGGSSAHTYPRVRQDLLSYMSGSGWVEGAPGPVGALWRREDVDYPIAVPSDVGPDSPEWRGVIERLANAEQVTPGRIEFMIATRRVDISNFQAPGDESYSSTIDFKAASRFVPSLYGMVRAAASCSFNLRGHIGGNFAARGEDVMSRARMAHTVQGSYIIPIWFPLGAPPESEQRVLPGTELRRSFEPPERRVTRTFAEAFAAVEEQVVRPARAPSNSEVLQLVEAGASRELLMSLDTALASPGVSAVSVRFAWAGEVTSPSIGVGPFNIPTEARPLVSNAASALRQAKRSAVQTMTGPIVEIRLPSGDAFGSVSIDTVRNGRRCELRILLPADAVRIAYEWAANDRTVVTEGRVTSSPGRSPEMRAPSRFGPLDEEFLFKNLTDESKRSNRARRSIRMSEPRQIEGSDTNSDDDQS